MVLRILRKEKEDVKEGRAGQGKKGYQGRKEGRKGQGNHDINEGRISRKI